MTKRITTVFEFTNDADIMAFWKNLHLMLQKLPNVQYATNKVGDEKHLEESYRAYAQFLQSAQMPDPSVPILVATTGEHFWKFADTLYANNPDFFVASKIYPTRQDLELSEGPCVEPPAPQPTENE